MSQNKTNSDDQEMSFASLFSDAKPVKHDKYVPNRKEKKKKRDTQALNDKHLEKQANASFEFSDGFEAQFSPNGPLKFVREGERADLVKLARKGDITPELILDLHGLSAESAKHEIAALIFEARKRHYQCVNIIHGLGSGILKRKVPSWLVQHPHVLGFHQAPLEWGGNGALLVLILQDQENSKFN